MRHYIDQKDISTFVYRSTHWAFARITNARLLTLVTNWSWYERAAITIVLWEIQRRSRKLIYLKCSDKCLTLNEVNKLSLLRTLESGRYLSMNFRSWDLYEYLLLQSTTKHSWAIKIATQLEKPWYVIFALQTGRKNTMSRDVSVFDDCNLTNIKLYLNSEFYISVRWPECRLWQKQIRYPVWYVCTFS